MPSSSDCVDIVAGLLGLVVLAAAAPIVWIAVKLEDRGSVFHRQVRVGQYGRPFEILKLRSMTHRPGQQLHWTAEGDERITRAGRVLRRLHLDELPQAWNILRGDMSVVGPRPEQTSTWRSCARASRTTTRDSPFARG